jgi:radical SAM superfamily enzyme YgiQ (UPF0313 family)
MSFRRIFVMNPPSELYRRDDRCQSKVEDQTVRVIFPPIELAVLCNVARNNGAEAVALKDYPTVGANLQDFIADIKEFQPDLILLNTTAHTINKDLAAFAAAREFFPGVRTVAKGEALAVQAQRILPNHRELDMILDGECELTFGEIVQDREPSEILGLIWRSSEGQCIHNPPRPFIQNLDDIPLPAHDLINHSLYRSPENNNIITAVYAQRGCPSKCIYCPAGSLYDYKVRHRSPNHVLDEIQLCVEKYGIRDFLFHGDTFTLNKRWLTELCEGLLSRGLKVRWGCNSRVDTIDDERAALMRKAGCWVVAFGFEHANQAILDHMKKGAKAEKSFEAVAICRRNGLKVHGFFVIGMPWETRETLDEFLAFVKKLDPDFFDFNIAYPLPGTEFYDIVERDKLWEHPDPLKGGYAQAAVRTYALSSKELTEWRRKALLSMYRRPYYIWRTLKFAAQTGNTKHYAKAALQRLHSLMG